MNKLEMLLHEQYVITSRMPFPKANVVERVYYVQNGQGAFPDKDGKTIYGYFVSSGTKMCIHGTNDVVRLADEEEREQARTIYRRTHGEQPQ